MYRVLSALLIAIVILTCGTIQIIPPITPSEELIRPYSINSSGSYLPSVTIYPESIFDIKFVSLRTLDDIRVQTGHHGKILKTAPGVPLGLITHNTLFLRADLSEKLFYEKNESEFTKDDISKHLIDIVFGPDNAKISRFKSDKDYKFFFTDKYTKEDIEAVFIYARLMNNLTNIAYIEPKEAEYAFISGKYEQIPYNYYRITLLPPHVFKEYVENKKPNEKNLKNKDGTIAAIVSNNQLILSDILTREEKNYFLFKGLLISMGFHGDTTHYPDSFFSTHNTNYSTVLSQIDKEAIKLLYGGRLQTDMDIENTRKALNLLRPVTHRKIGG